MTGFASASGASGPHSWGWELRSVNGKGLDLRLRVPDWLTGLEAQLKARLTNVLSRGSVTLNLRIAREEQAGRLTVNTAALDEVLAAL
ncbi:YicC/YloC family endoribonuclease, partial [uncultured Sulfitobacter sp.]|uniref:YicC/YloC family endoribonuclease n=1 Tax=uncultured Sulfitobacter sp. TaxID=191468 RepID=UPI00259A58C3